jgi:pimeloyl-ACP methyl ester carboxylesterase
LASSGDPSASASTRNPACSGTLSGKEPSVYAADWLARCSGFKTPVSLESADCLLRFRPKDAVARLAPRPLLLLHGAGNRLNPVSESIELHRRAGEAKELVILEGVGHTEWMYDWDPTFMKLVAIVRRFLENALAVPAAA